MTMLLLLAALAVQTADAGTPPNASIGHTVTWAPDRSDGVAIVVFAPPLLNDDDTRAQLQLAAAEYNAAVTRLTASDGPLQLPWSNDRPAADEALAILAEAHRLARISKGALHWSCNERAALWQTARTTQVAPSNDDIEAVRKRCDSDVRVDLRTRTVTLREGAVIDVTILVRAYALQRASLWLVEHGLVDHIIDVGGDVVVHGMRGPQPWRVGLQDPRGTEPFAAGDAKNEAVAVVSDRTTTIVDGKRWHDTLDPRSGSPAQNSRMVAVFGPDAVTAKALATALFVLGDVEGKAMLSACKGYEAVWVLANNKTVLSPGARARLRVRPPTE
jgi:FAD:protein FMN transferase